MTMLPDRAEIEDVARDSAKNNDLSHWDGEMPLLLVCIDVEEEFDWDKPFTRDHYGLSSIEEIPNIVVKLNGLGVTPALLVDYPVLADVKAASSLVGLYEKGQAHFGTQLHAWVNPPFEEELSSHNSYAGNLPKPLEAAKLQALTRRFEAVFGERPKLFRSGRYGYGPNTAALLQAEGYEIDLTLFANRDFSSDGGPNFQGVSTHPFFDEKHPGLFHIPLTSGYWGVFSFCAPALIRLSETRLGRVCHLRGILERLHLAGISWLSPEGVRLPSAKNFARRLVRQGQKVLVLSFHSPSLRPGNTRYVMTEAERVAFYQWLEDFITAFKTDLGGRPTTAFEILELWRSQGS